MRKAEGLAQEKVLVSATVGSALIQIECSQANANLFGPPQVKTEKTTIALDGRQFSEMHIELALADAQHIVRLLEQSPAKANEIVNLVSTGRLLEAYAAAGSFGLRETDFRNAGGGFWGLVVLLVIVLVSLPGDSPVPTAEQVSKTFKTKAENEKLFDGLK